MSVSRGEKRACPFTTLSWFYDETLIVRQCAMGGKFTECSKERRWIFLHCIIFFAVPPPPRSLLLPFQVLKALIVVGGHLCGLRCSNKRGQRLREHDFSSRNLCPRFFEQKSLCRELGSRRRSRNSAPLPHCTVLFLLRRSSKMRQETLVVTFLALPFLASAVRS